MRFSRLSCCVLAAFLTLISIRPAVAQFAVQPVKDDTEFEFEKPVQLYYTPRFNRVEGLFANIGVRLRPPAAPGWNFHADAGWGFWNESGQEFRFHVGGRKDMFDINRLSVGWEAFRELASEDEWVIGEVENSIFALLFRDDYKDYYGIQGVRFFAEQKVHSKHLLRLVVERRNYDAQKRNIDWSVFKGDFPENPTLPSSTILNGDELSFKLVATYDGRDNPIFPLSGWHLQGIYEHTELDFDTDGFFLTVKRFQQTIANHRLLMRALLGTRTGSLADQHTMDLGGLGSLRGFDDKEFTGNRLLLLNANYLFGGDILQRIPLQNAPIIGTFWSTLSMGVFMDVGQTNIVPTDSGLLDGFGDIFDNLKSDIGLSLLVLDGVLRMDVGRRLGSDPGRDDYRFTFRILESF